MSVGIKPLIYCITMLFLVSQTFGLLSLFSQIYTFDITASNMSPIMLTSLILNRVFIIISDFINIYLGNIAQA